MIRHDLRIAVVAMLLATATTAVASAQGTDTASSPPAPRAQGSQPTSPPIDFSGVIFGSYAVRTDSAARAQTGGKNPNQFTVDRVYLTFRMPVGDRGSIRVTTDIFQNAAVGSFYGGWVARLKYGYLQYELLRDVAGHKGFDALARVGMLHTVVIDHEEQFWPRYLSQVGVERFGFFSSADVGAATQVTLPGRWGEVYAHLTNGPGYTSPETDRFKDAALRLTLTPLAGRAGLFQTLAISPWFYDGFRGSRFAAGGTGQLGPVTAPVERDRWGIFVGERDPRITLGMHYAQRTDGFEYGANTATSPRTVSDTTGTLLSVYAIARPINWRAGKSTSRLGAVLRWDRFCSHRGVQGSERLLIAGLEYQPNSRTALALDFQELKPDNFLGRAPTDATRTFSVHWSATF